MRLNRDIDYRAGEHLRDVRVGKGDTFVLILNITVPHCLVHEMRGTVAYSRL